MQLSRLRVRGVLELTTDNALALDYEGGILLVSQVLSSGSSWRGERAFF